MLHLSKVQGLLIDSITNKGDVSVLEVLVEFERLLKGGLIYIQNRKGRCQGVVLLLKVGCVQGGMALSERATT